MRDQSTDDTSWNYTVYFPHDPCAAAILRRTLRLVLTAYGLTGLAASAELIATELVTNALRHTKGPAALHLHHSARTLRITVWDADPTPPQPTQSAPDDEAGRGLTLVQDSATAWGWSQLAADSSVGGKLIWCELARAA